MSKGRVLVVENLPEWREELVEILHKAEYQVDSASSLMEALKKLNETLYHVLVLDIRLDETDQSESNNDGIELLDHLKTSGLSKAIKVIILSAFGNIESARIAFRDYDVADFLGKNPFNETILLECIQRVFSQKVKINLDLDVKWDSKMRPEEAVLNLIIHKTRVKRGSDLQQRIAAEFKDLLCRLFHQANSVIVKPLTAGFSGMGVLHVKPFYRIRGRGQEVVVKFGDLHKIEEEHNNFKEYVQPLIGGARNSTVVDVHYTPRLGGIIYSLLGASNDELVDFGTFYHNADLPRIKNTLDGFLRDTCGSWYDSPGYLRPLDLPADYKRLFHYSSTRLERIVARQLKSVQGKQRLSFDALNSNRTFTNPLLATKTFSSVHSTYVSITHGDCNPYNLLVDKAGRIWLIDFQQTGESHILRDIAMLDSVVRLQLLTSEEATLEERLFMEEALSSAESFSQVEQLLTNFSTENQALNKAFATVVHLRTLARNLVAKNSGEGIREYYIALLYTAMSTLQFFSLPLRQREHALLCASLLTDKVGIEQFA